MSDSAAEIAAAESRSAQARARLDVTLHRLQAKLKPRTIARDAARSAADAGQSAALAVKANPAPLAGAVAALGLFLARHRIVALVRRKKKHAAPAPPRAPKPPETKGKKQ